MWDNLAALGSQTGCSFAHFLHSFLFTEKNPLLCWWWLLFLGLLGWSWDFLSSPSSPRSLEISRSRKKSKRKIEYSPRIKRGFRFACSARKVGNCRVRFPRIRCRWRFRNKILLLKSGIVRPSTRVPDTTRCLLLPYFDVVDFTNNDIPLWKKSYQGFSGTRPLSPWLPRQGRIMKPFRLLLSWGLIANHFHSYNEWYDPNSWDYLNGTRVGEASHPGRYGSRVTARKRSETFENDSSLAAALIQVLHSHNQNSEWQENKKRKVSLASKLLQTLQSAVREDWADAEVTASTWQSHTEGPSKHTAYRSPGYEDHEDMAKDGWTPWGQNQRRKDSNPPRRVSWADSPTPQTEVQWSSSKGYSSNPPPGVSRFSTRILPSEWNAEVKLTTINQISKATLWSLRTLKLWMICREFSRPMIVKQVLLSELWILHMKDQQLVCGGRTAELFNLRLDWSCDCIRSRRLQDPFSRNLFKSSFGNLNRTNFVLYD